MDKTRFLTIGIIILLVLNAVSLFILFHMHMGAKGGHGMHGDDNGPADYISRTLKFDDMQNEQFAALRNQHHEMLRKAHQEDERLNDLYFSLLKSDSPDKTKVDSIATLIGNQRKLLATTAFEHFQQLRAICHDDQKKLFDDTIDEIARMVAQHGPPH